MILSEKPKNRVRWVEILFSGDEQDVAEVRNNNIHSYAVSYCLLLVKFYRHPALELR